MTPTPPDRALASGKPFCFAGGRRFFGRPFFFTNVLRRIAIAAFLLGGLVLVFDAGYIHAKAWLGQKLLVYAWQNTQNTHQPNKPWWWADTFPVAVLSAPKYHERLFVLHGTNGEALAWGPGWLPSSAAPGESGNSVIAAHRDTHFSFLQHIQLGDHLVIENEQRQQFVYEVIQTRVIDIRDMNTVQSDDQKKLTLVTCYPFDALATRGHQRLLVEARQINMNNNEG
jgi:sortase, marine proteobacterial type